MEDSKLMKFKLLIDEVDDYLKYRKMIYKVRTTSGDVLAGVFAGMLANANAIADGINLYPLSLEDGNSGKQNFRSKILFSYTDNVFTAELDKKFNTETYINNSEFEFVMFYKKHKTTPFNQNSAYRLIFWLLFAAAVDDKIYNNELSTIIDMAYCMDFTEDMVRDWCYAVEYVLSGNKLGEDCGLKLASRQGENFFLHIEEV